MSNERHEEKQSKHKEDAEEIREIFSALNESIPTLISRLIGSVYSPEIAASIATAIGRFYTKLKEEGIPDNLALKMTEQYVSGLDFAKILEMASGESKGRHISIEKEKHDEDEEEE